MHFPSLVSSLSLIALARCSVLPLSASKAPRAADFADAACAVTFDGRVKSSAALTDLDSSSTSYNWRSNFVLGQNLKWSQVAQFPNVTQSIGDQASDSKAVEVTISDASIFNPSGNSPQNGFRRAELLAGSTGASSAYFQGQKTLHFSLQLDASKPLNYSHEYQLFFIESSDYSTNQIVLKTGTILDGTSSQKSNPKYLYLLGNLKTSPPKQLFSTPFTSGWHNFAVTLDFSKNTVQVYYSKNQDSLKASGSAQANDLSGQGEIHFGVLKKPTGSTDVVNNGFQERGIHEGIIYGGIYEESGANGCSTVSTKAGYVTQDFYTGTVTHDDTLVVEKRQSSVSQGGSSSSSVDFEPANFDQPGIVVNNGRHQPYGTTPKPNKNPGKDKGVKKDDCGPSKKKWKIPSNGYPPKSSDGSGTVSVGNGQTGSVGGGSITVGPPK